MHYVISNVDDNSQARLDETNASFTPNGLTDTDMSLVIQ